MPVDQVVFDTVALGEEVYVADKLIYVVEELILVVGSHRPGREVYHPGVVAERLDLRGGRVLEAGENVNAFPSPPKLAAQLAHIYVHTAGLAPTKQRLGTGQRAGM